MRETMFVLPPGTTLRSLIEELLPEMHRTLVPKTESGRYTVAVTLSARNGADAFELAVNGGEVKASRGGSDGGDVALWVDAAIAQAFLDDWAGAGRFRPKFVPKAGPTAPTDPRLLKRVAMASGVFELALTDFPLEGRKTRAAIRIALGAAGKKVLDQDTKVDVTLETTVATYERLLAGEVPPEEALDHPDVAVRGKRFIAMQAALALAPWLTNAEKQGG